MAENQLPPAVRTLIAAVLGLVRSTRSGRVALAQAHALVDPAAVPVGLRAAVTAELDSAAAAVTPLAGRTVAKILKDAWDEDPDRVLEGLDLDAPLAVTPGAQVHRARHDGVDVVVKVLRPGVAESVRSELGLLETLTGPAGAAFPAIDAGAVIREVRERVLDALDLEHEASTQRTVARTVRRHPWLTVPSPITELCHERVLVATYVPGPTLAAGVPPGRDTGQVARAVLRAAIGLTRTPGVIHADLDPANILLTKGEGIALVDFGATRRVDVARLDQGLAALRALREGDESAFEAATQALGVLPDDGTSRRALQLLRTVGGELLTGPARLDADALIALAGRAETHMREGLAVAMVATLDPQDLWALRMLATLVATIARLGATEDWIALTLVAGHEGC